MSTRPLINTSTRGLRRASRILCGGDAAATYLKRVARRRNRQEARRAIRRGDYDAALRCEPSGFYDIV